MDTKPRQRKGQPIGGQYAPGHRPCAATVLEGPVGSVVSDQIGVPAGDLDDTLSLQFRPVDASGTLGYHPDASDPDDERWDAACFEVVAVVTADIPEGERCHCRDEDHLDCHLGEALLARDVPAFLGDVDHDFDEAVAGGTIPTRFAYRLGDQAAVRASLRGSVTRHLAA